MIMKKWVLSMVVIALLAAGSGCGEKSSVSLEKYQVGEYSEKNGHPSLTLFENEESSKEVELKMDGQKDLAKALYQYSGMITVNAEIASNGTLLDYTIQDLFTGESYGKLNAEGLYDTFDPERFETVEKNYQEEIRLSELDSDITYKYRDAESSSGRIINDTGQNVLVYYDDLPDHQSGRYRLFGSCLSGGEDSITLPAPRKSFSIRFQNQETDEMIQYYDNDNIIRLSNYHSGDSFYVDFQTALYNDSGQDVILTGKDGAEIRILQDQLIRLDWNVKDFRTFESDFVLK